MKVEALKTERIEDFIAYCKKHKAEIDDSFLYDQDLVSFEPNAENPTYILTSHLGEIIGTASLIIDEYNRRGGKGRFRIFHSSLDEQEHYSALLEAILPRTEGLDKLVIFIPVENRRLINSIEGLNFVVERYALLLIREDLDIPEIDLPSEYSIRDFRPGYDEEAWCSVRNAGFANLQGNDTPITPEMVRKKVSSEDYLDGGMKILYHKENPVGVVSGSADEYEGAPIMNIGPLAILPEYQGKGLGRILLRESLKFAKEKFYKRTVLSVNGENELAQTLYLQEGFKQVEAVTCYKYDLKANKPKQIR